MRFAVVGHVEWIEFACVPRYPAPGEVVHASETWQEAGGGGGVAAVQLAKLAGGADFFTAIADDESGRRTRERLEAHGVRVHSALREGAQRRCFTHVDDDLPWELLEGADAVYFTLGDQAALRRARAARVLVATPRAQEALLGS